MDARHVALGTPGSRRVSRAVARGTVGYGAVNGMWRSLVSAPALGAGGRRFESGHPDHVMSRDIGDRCLGTSWTVRPAEELVVLGGVEGEFLSCARSRASSARSSSSSTPVPALRRRLSAAAQFPSVPSLMPRSRATYAIGFPGLPDQPHRAHPEVLIELPACLTHRRLPLTRCPTREAHRAGGRWRGRPTLVHADRGRPRQRGD